MFINLTFFVILAILCLSILQTNYCHSGSLSLAAELNQLKKNGLQTIGLSTNGIVLAKKLSKLHQAGLDNINISLDTLIPAKFELITRRKGWDRVIHGMNEALEMDFKNIKVIYLIV